MTVLARMALGTVLAGIAGAAGFFAYRFMDPNDRPRAGLPPSALDIPTESPPRAETTDGLVPGARSIPENLPDFELLDRSGEHRRLSEWSGRPLIVNFWATWCAPCRREIPLLKALRRQHAREGLEVIGVAVDLRDAVLEYADEIGIDYPLLIGEDDGLRAVEAFGMDLVFPFTVFADRRDRIVAVKVGELHEDEAMLILERVHAIDAGRLPLESARREITARLRGLAVKRAKSAADSDNSALEVR